MKFNPEKHYRRSIRLHNYDYSAGTYFVTICSKDRECLLGDIIDHKMELNEYGRIVERYWINITNHYPYVYLDEYIIMPNHLHGILIIKNDLDNRVGVQNFEPLQRIKNNKFQHIIPKSLGSIIRGFKIGVTKWFRKNTEIYIFWQRNYYEHIVYNEEELGRIRRYISNNPYKWTEDKDNPINIRNQ